MESFKINASNKMHFFATLLLQTTIATFLINSIKTEQEIFHPPIILKYTYSDEIFLEGNIFEKKPLQLLCIASGNPKPDFYWTKNGKNITSKQAGYKIKQETTISTLMIEKPTYKDLGNYQCFAQNYLGVASSGMISIESLKNFTADFTRLAKVYTPLRLECTDKNLIGSKPPNIDYSSNQKNNLENRPKTIWIKKCPISNDVKYLNNPRMVVDPTGSLCIAFLISADSNCYFVCVVQKNSKITFENKYLIDIMYNIDDFPYVRPQYLSNPRENFISGEEIELFCIYSGNPLPTMTWLKDGKEILESERVKIKTFGKSLKINPVWLQDEGIYGCKATNGHGTDQYHEIKVNVSTAPFFLHIPKNSAGFENETLELKCSVDGRPYPKITWFKNNQLLGTLADSNLLVKQEKLVIKQLTKFDTGIYACNVTNYLGFVFKEFFVYMLERKYENCTLKNLHYDFLKTVLDIEVKNKSFGSSSECH